MIFRIDVSTVGPDRLGEAVRHQIEELGIDHVGAITTRRIFLVDAPKASIEQMNRAAAELLADPIVERATVASSQPPSNGRGHSLIEIHLKPGVMDPVAASTEMALRDMGIPAREVRTGRAFVIDNELPREQLDRIATRVLANGVIESVHFEPFVPREFARGQEQPFRLRHVPLRGLADADLTKLSREAHLFLSLTEMKSIQSYYRQQDREPTDVELETIAQTWSEHCVHKTLKSAVEVYDESGNVIRRYGNLIKETIFASTKQLMDGDQGDFCLSVFKDNAGVIAFDDVDGVCFKVETHNHPSAIEPYGGSATGVGGVIRDVLGTGLAAKPIANTDVFCVAFPEQRKLPKGVIHPKRVLQQVVAGVRDYGNRMGIPTVNGAVYFDDRYIGNPLVFCGCVGLIPRDKIEKAARAGDAIVLMGGRTGRDGIHGATFSSAELTDTHADEFSHAVQIGNAITEKKLADVIIQARDASLFTAITDCGAGGLSSAVGEMGEKLGASVELDKVPLKYAGLRYDEIWISEAQERMVLSVPKQNVEALLKLAASEEVEATVIGHFGADDRQLVLNYRGTEVGRLSMQFLHDGIPMPTRRAILPRGTGASPVRPHPEEPAHERGAHAPEWYRDRLLKLLSHPNNASKHWIIRQYDHEVQGGSVIKPLVGPQQIGPSDAAVIRPKFDSFKGVAIACGLAPHIEDPHDMTIASIDEAIRNAVCVGADPDRMAILDNFCWPSVDDEKTMGTLVAACEACRDAALAYGIPFISGKDSLHNQFTNSETGEVIRIPRTLLISAIGVIDDVRKCVTMDLKGRTNRVVLVAARDPRDLSVLSRTHRLVASIIREGRVISVHDLSDGGLFVAVAEMCIASGKGLIVGDELFTTDDSFAERPGRYLLELGEFTEADELRRRCGDVADVVDVGLVQHFRKLTVTSKKERVLEMSLDELTQAWRGTLDW
jgi:phosphoribosylformylglycinamidine synthase